MNSNELKNLNTELKECFLNAGKRAMHLRDMGLKTELKNDNTPVTNGDLEVNKIITNKLKEITPEIPIVSEEVSDNKNSNNLSTFWLIDPIDGTYDYLNNKEEFTLNAGLIINKKPDIKIKSIENIIKKEIFIPDTKIIDVHVAISNIVWPMSGWYKSKIEIIVNIIKLRP